MLDEQCIAFVVELRDRNIARCCMIEREQTSHQLDLERARRQHHVTIQIDAVDVGAERGERENNADARLVGSVVDRRIAVESIYYTAIKSSLH